MPGRAATFTTGTASGLFNGSFGIGGPPVILFFFFLARRRVSGPSLDDRLFL